MEPAGKAGTLAGGFPCLFPIANRLCRVSCVGARQEHISAGSILLSREHVVLALAVRERLRPHGHHLEGAVIHRDRPAFAVFSLAFPYPHPPTDEINLLPLEQANLGI